MNIPKTIANAALGKVVGSQIGSKGLVGLGLGVTALKIATRSVPGAMLIGTGLVLAAYVKKKQADKEAEQLDPQSELEEIGAKETGTKDIGAYE